MVLEVLRRHILTDAACPKTAAGKAAPCTTPRGDGSLQVDENNSDSEDECEVRALELECAFEDGSGRVEFIPGKVLTTARMRDKLKKYVGRAAWPLAGNILRLDPVLCTVVWEGPAGCAPGEQIFLARWSGGGRVPRRERGCCGHTPFCWPADHQRDPGRRQLSESWSQAGQGVDAYTASPRLNVLLIPTTQAVCVDVPIGKCDCVSKWL